MIAFGVMLVFAGIIMLIVAIAQAAQNRSYAACSENVNGIVTRKRNRNVKNGVSHELTVSYTVHGVSYEKVVGALVSEFETIAVGDRLELKYKPGNPKKAVRPQELNPRNVRVILFIAMGLTVAGVALFLIGYK